MIAELNEKRKQVVINIVMLTPLSWQVKRAKIF